MRLARVVFAALVFVSCTYGAPCRTSNECGSSGICLPVGACAMKCTSGSACIAGEKCSAGGGCIPAGACGEDRDCSGSNVCRAGGCYAIGGTGGSGAGGAGGTTGGAGGGGAMGCGGELFQSTHVDANFLIVLDHSGSMMESINGTPKWSSAVSAIRSTTALYQAQINFGLSMFSTPTQCDPGANQVAVGFMTAPQISGAMPVLADGKGTPIGGALHLAAMHQGLHDATRANFVMVVTDGKENCGGNPVNEVKALAVAGIKTFVVGFGADIDTNMLTNMALNGGTARNTLPRYYQADDQAGLATAFSSIAQGAIGCDFRLAKAPPDPSKIFVYVNGQLIPRDPNRVVGWEYTSGTERITLYGTVCDAAANNPQSKVNIIYGCPDPTLIEGGGGTGGGGGSPPIDLDAGITIG